MGELLVPPRVEPGVVTVLAGRPYWVGSRFPNPEPVGAGGAVRVSASGGDVRDVVVSRQTVLIECWGDSESVAWGVAVDAAAMLRAAAGTTQGGVIFRFVECTLPVNLPDYNRPAKVRYQFVCTVHSRMTLLEA